MTRFRLFHILEERLVSFDLGDHPPYLAASHTWSENVFPSNTPFADCFAGKGMRTVIQERCPDVQFCWFDTVCIDQNDDHDKLEQIPLMDRIFGEARCVVVFICTYLNATQREVDWLSEKLDGALAMCQAEAWKEEGDYWKNAEGRKWLMLGKQCLLRLASTAWATRIWTLQEYVLASSILWIGLDLHPIRVDDYMLSALPDVCNSLAIEECLTPEFKVLDSHFAGMANARLKTIDRTRIMELPGNRKATVPVDEVYGCMAASGVTIKPIALETKAQAWFRWCEVAIRQGHLRWILGPISAMSFIEGEQQNCVFPRFSDRHEISGCSGLDAVKPLGPTNVSQGCITTSARLVGSARICRRLGKIHEPEPGSIHRDITLILFAESTWSLALKLVWSFGGGRYNPKQAQVIAQVLVQSYARAVRTVACQKEESFEPVLSSAFQRFVWNDFLALQQSRMLAVNVGVSYLCSLRLSIPESVECYTVLVAGEDIPQSSLSVLDFQAEASDGRLVPMVVQSATLEDGTATFHKVGMTLGISEELANHWRSIPLQEVRIGGLGCSGCRKVRTRVVELEDHGHVSKSLIRYRRSHWMRMMERQQERIRYKLFSQKVTVLARKSCMLSAVTTRPRTRGLRFGLERSHTRFSNFLKERRL